MKEPLTGKKTYIAAALTIAGFWGAFLSESVSFETTITLTAEAVMVIFLRLGIAKGKS